MSDFIDELFLRLACETPLPNSIAGRRTEKSTPTKPYTRAQAKIEQQAGLLPSPPLQPPTSSRKRGRKSEFDIFNDADAARTPYLPTPKRLKPAERIPLSVRTDLANDTPLPTPRQPGRPFPFSHSDPLWENVENHDPRPHYNPRSNYMTPPSTPGGPSTPSPSPSPFASSRRSTRAVQRRRPSANPLPPPRNETLYLALHLDSWKVTEEQIKNAYRKIAIEHHPDKVAEEERETATHMMQNVNAAKDVLLDSKRRRAYHMDGKLPWTT